MPKRNDIRRVVILGSGPIMIGQACEFDYSGTQACKALMQEGFEVILINSNPATIMTDPQVATRVYLEPLTVPYVEKILQAERPQAIIPTLGGQTALNLCLELERLDILKMLNIEILGATKEVIEAAEDREKFRNVLDQVGAKYPKSEMVRSIDQGLSMPNKLGLPLILRPNYTLGGGGGGVAYTIEEYELMLTKALKESPTSEVLIEESILGWKEFELEVMRDRLGTFVIVCSIENIDPCGVHTGDSITVAPQQTLSDFDYQAMRNETKKIIEAVGLEVGGANVQFAVHPTTGERYVIEMNPRVSRSSALASKATGFPIAKIAALLAVGYTLEELKNDITGSTPCAFEPALDYVVVKIPRFAFEKFEGSRDFLSTQMKSVGEVMAIGRTFLESLGKAISALEVWQITDELIYSEAMVAYPNSYRLPYLLQGFRQGQTIERMHELTQITPWFLEQFEKWMVIEKKLKSQTLDKEAVIEAKRHGFSDFQLSQIFQKSELEIRQFRWDHGITPVFYQVDTCAGEFKSETPYFYSTYWGSQGDRISNPKVSSIVVIGSGPNRIGQGIEFDYSCVRGVKHLRELGYSVAMINSNPETVSTDYDTSNELFFEPLTTEYVLEVCRVVNPVGFVAQLGGQTPIDLAPGLVHAGWRLLGSSLNSIDLAEDRLRFSEICKDLEFSIPASGMAAALDQALEITHKIGYPIICRPSYVLGGRRMQVIESSEELAQYFEKHGNHLSAQRPCLIDQFLEGALEVDVDLVRASEWSMIGGIVEHIEAAGVHSGDSMGVLPPQRLRKETCQRIEEMSLALAEKMQIIGHMNLQLAIKNEVIYMLEANPRSSRSVPFVAKATGLPLVDLAIEAMLGKNDLYHQVSQWTHWDETPFVCVKGVVFPFKKFSDADSLLGPEMKSTGETMGRGQNYSEALMKAFVSSHVQLPAKGEVFLSLRDKDKTILLPLIQKLKFMGFTISATRGTADFLYQEGVDCIPVKKVDEGRPHCVDRIRSGHVALVINTTSGRRSIEASFTIRRSCVDFGVPCVTESQAAEALVTAMKRQQESSNQVYPL